MRQTYTPDPLPMGLLWLHQPLVSAGPLALAIQCTLTLDSIHDGIPSESTISAGEPSHRPSYNAHPRHHRAGTALGLAVVEIHTRTAFMA